MTFAVVMCTVAASLAAEEAPTRPEDRKAIAALTAEFIAAYDKGDLQALAKLFVPAARSIDEEGQVAQGREAIVGRFAAAFADSPGSKITIAPASLEFLGPDAAVETGSATVTPADGRAPTVTAYSVVYLQIGRAHV